MNLEKYRQKEIKNCWVKAYHIRLAQGQKCPNCGYTKKKCNEKNELF